MAPPDFYPPADKATQWFEDNYPGDRMDVNVLVLHTTETTGWPSYDGGAKAPNLTARPNFALKRLDWRQHFRINTSSRALRNLAGGVETNTLNVVQVELVGTCDPSYPGDALHWPDAPDWALNGLAAFVGWCHETQGVPLTVPKLWLPYPQSYGASSARMSFTAWNNFKGVCGHQHVPENVHGDPGNIDIDYILAKAGDDMDQATFTKYLTAALADAEVRKAMVKAVLGTDGVIPAPSTAPDKAGNPYWVGWSFLRETIDDLAGLKQQP